MTLNPKIAISDPFLSPKSQNDVNSALRKSELRKGAILLILSIIVAVGGLSFYFASQGILPHLFNAISHSLGHTTTHYLGIGALVLGTVGVGYAGLNARRIFLNTVRGEILYSHHISRNSHARKEALSRFSGTRVCTLKNIPQLSTISGHGVKSKFSAFKQRFIKQIKTALDGKITGHDHPEFTGAKQSFLKQLETYERKSVRSTDLLNGTTEGVCFGFLMHCGKRVLKGESIETVAKEFTGGGSDEITALQQFYTSIPSSLISAEQAVLGTLGLEVHSTDNPKEEGVYIMRVKMPDRGSHVIMLQVTEDHVYLLDSNYFLIKFDKDSFPSEIKDFLALYYSTAEKIPLKNFSLESVGKHFEMYQLSLNQNSDFHVAFDKTGKYDPMLFWGEEENL